MPQIYGAECQRRHLIGEPSAIGAARRDAQRLAEEAGLDQTATARVAVVTTELATNVLSHGGGGEVLLRILSSAHGSAVEILALDRGPGIADLQRSLADGYSSRSTPGNGLGAVRRMTAVFDVYSVSGRGTIVLGVVGLDVIQRFGAVCVAREGERECGDTWRIADTENGWAIMVADGLGHGPVAAIAAQAAAAAFVASPADAPRAQIERMHRSLSGTRGAAVACAAWSNPQELQYAGIGNISGHLCAPGSSRGLVSHSGTLGFQMQRVQQFDYAVSPGALLVMHSDGLSARWQLEDQPGLRTHHPAVIAAALYRDFSRGRDDATVLVMQL